MQDQGVLIDVALHIGTMLAIVLYCRRDIFAILLAVLQGPRAKDQDMRRLGYAIALGSIPALVVGGLMHVALPDGIRSVNVIIFTMIFFGLVLGLADLFSPQEKDMRHATIKNIFLIGCAQVLALIPGTSRSGITITAARRLGFARVDAARLSFLIGLPVMAAAGCVSLLEIAESKTPGLWTEALWAIVFSFVAGLAAIHFMMTWLRRSSLMPFVFYRMLLGGFLAVYFLA